MSPVPTAGTVAVTGAAGFVGGHVVQPSSTAATASAPCVRDVDDDAKVGFLKAMNPYASGRLTLHAADLDEPGCFDEVFRGATASPTSPTSARTTTPTTCGGRATTSSPASSPRDRCVASSSRRAWRRSSRRPTSTSSPAGRSSTRTASPTSPTRSARPSAARATRWARSSPSTPSPTPPRRAAGGTPITVCPADNVGPILSAHHKDGGPWQHLIERMLEGRCEIFQGTGPYRPWMTVDVRDDAASHVGLLESDSRSPTASATSPGRRRPALRGHRPSIDRVLPELHHDPGEIADNSPDRWKEREAEFRSIWAGLSCATTASAPPSRSRSGRSTTPSATASSRCWRSPTPRSTAARNDGAVALTR